MAPPSLLTPLQNDLLKAFFSRAYGKAFFISGGTALAEFYLHHRYSEDLDLFTLDDDAFRQAATGNANLAAQLRCSYRDQVATATFHQVFFNNSQEAAVKVDIVRDFGPQFDEPHQFGAVIADAELNIAVNKITAVFGRASEKDFVDLYFLLKKGYDLWKLIDLAKEKDPGLNEFYLAIMMRQIAKVDSLPRMIKPLTLEELRAFFLPLAEQIMLKAKPHE